jgi:hypothetical protein
MSMSGFQAYQLPEGHQAIWEAVVIARKLLGR